MKHVFARFCSDYQVFTIFFLYEFEKKKFMHGNILRKYTEELRQIPRQKLSAKHPVDKWRSGEGREKLTRGMMAVK